MENIHALVIDDSQTGLEVLTELLATVGATATTIQDSSDQGKIEGLLADVDIIFLDLEMPKIDGYEMLDILREEMGFTAPIVAYTVHTSEIDTVRSLGFDGLIGKPMDLREFPQQLERLLNGEPVWAI